MKLRSIELTNVRRFAGRSARLSGIGDGITVLCQPNEFGKSTIFDALHAVFFERHTSKNAVVKALQPHAGGAPTVAVELDLPEGRFRVVKRWLQRPEAHVLEASGRLIAQADEAEAWIDKLLGGGLSGPSGLLWVRQGLVGLEPDGRSADDQRQKERGLAARRDLLSSVSGEIDAMTGGRRMDAVADRVAAALSLLATESGRPKANGEWKRALDEVEALAAKEADLRPRAERLSGDLRRRTEVQRALARLTDPMAVGERAAALAQAEAALEVALAHQSRVAQAETVLRLARMDFDRVETEVRQIVTLSSRLAEAEEALRQAGEAADAARTRADELAQREHAASLVHDREVNRTRNLRRRRDRADRARAAQAALRQVEDLQRRLARASELQARLDQALAGRALVRVTPEALAAAEKAQAALEVARARAEAQAVTIEAVPAGDAQALLAGRPLPSGPQRISVRAELSLPGFGILWIDPGEARAFDASAETLSAQQALEDALTACRVESLAAAREALAEGRAFDAEIMQMSALLAEVAPDGIDSLRLGLASALAEKAEAPVEEEAGDVETLAASLAAAEAEEAEALSALRVANTISVEANQVRAVTEANRTTAERLLVSARTEAGDPVLLAERLAELNARAPSLAEACARSEATLAGLGASAPDLETIEARLSRARGASEQATRET